VPQQSRAKGALSRRRGKAGLNGFLRIAAVILLTAFVENRGMRAIGLTALLLGALAFLYPEFPQLHRFIPMISFDKSQSMMLGGLLVAVGALTLAIYRPSDG
jgi:hypothetical protein